MKLLKETKLHGKWYDDACGTAFGLELVGERWGLLVVRELMLGGRRFSDIRASLPGISAKVLTERLESLERAGVLHRRKLQPPIAGRVYELTRWGYAAEPVLQELGRWAAMSPLHNPTLPLSPVSIMLSLRTMLDVGLAHGHTMRAGFVIGDETFVAELADGNLPIHRAEVEHTGFTFRVPAAPVLAALFYGPGPVEELEEEVGLVIEGNRDLALAFVSLFNLPGPPGASSPIAGTPTAKSGLSSA